MCGLLVNFSDIQLAREWGPMQIAELQHNFDNLVRAAEELEAELDKLPWKQRNKLIKEWNGPSYIDPQYRPWGGLFEPKERSDRNEHD